MSTVSSAMPSIAILDDPCETPKEESAIQPGQSWAAEPSLEEGGGCQDRYNKEELGFLRCSEKIQCLR